VNLPIVALANLPEARLRSQLRFRFLTPMGMAMTLATAILMIAMAWAGLGAYSFVLPLPILNAIRAAVYWSAAGVRIRCEPQWRRWRFLVADSLYITGATVGLVVIAQADAVVLGRLTDATELGFYYFAIGLSMQTVRLVAMNLASVLFPALSHLQFNPTHQVSTFLRATRIVALLSMPICLLQAVLADPAVRLLFPEKWYPAIVLLEVLSVAMAFRSLSFLASSLLQARGRFAARCAAAVGGAIVFTALVYFTALRLGAFGVAIGVLIFHVAFALSMVSLAVMPVANLMSKLWQTVLNPFLLSLASVGTARGLVWLLPATLQSPLPVILLTTLLAGAIHTLLIRWLTPQTWSEIGARVSQVLRRSERPAQ
jgi:lipopolysaccharide exporter